MDWNLSPEAWAGIVTGFVLFALIPITGIKNKKAKKRRIGKGYSERVKNRQERLGRRKP